ncbi:Acid phosphatase type 7 [Acropora cervicornis]|uniref:Purple acid phosphatase n=1 Tax=Acropora cervicornis TaxID=6130 RepID=A0AAD9V4Q6_ACRCE|nr:Acid phosphatase type 7 [Acropora cervicornis]
MVSFRTQTIWFELLLLVCFSQGNDPQPEQIHLSSTGNPSEVIVTWVTLSSTKFSIVEYNKVGFPLTMRAFGSITKFVDGGTEHRVLFMHRVKLTGLIADQVYEYHCGGLDGWSAIFSFKTFKPGVNWSPRLAVFGDLGSVNAKSLSYLQEETQSGHFDAILHVGDFAYNMDSSDARVGDDFMNQIQPVAAYVPYMTCPGNHEQAYNFSNYRNRFTMPGNTEGIFYSWNIGPAHIISISTEVYFFLRYGNEQIAHQYHWLEKDLREASAPENRTLRPWIITMGHRPMYCSNDDGDDCTQYESVVRGGISIPPKRLFGLEDLFYKYGVDLSFWAHEHSFERLFPLFNRTVCNGSKEEPYTNPCAPVHVTTGSAGCHEDHDGFEKDYPPWTAFRSDDYGYTRMTIHNSTHLYLEQVSVDLGGNVIDKLWIIKDLHGPDAWVTKSYK